jgi:hypothetical protein
MSRAPRVDPLHHLGAAMARPGQPEATSRVLDAAMGATRGHKLFTCLLLDAAAGQAQRRYTNQPAAYRVGGRNPVEPTPWTRQVLDEGRPCLGHAAEDIRAVFLDHELIASLGCASVPNVPVAWAGRTPGTINLLHEARWYDEGDMPLARVVAALAAPAFLAAWS